MFKKLLIANRGEIAIRIARTAAQMGVSVVTVHTADDARCLHVKHGDQSCELPGAGAAGYMDVDALIRTAVETGCEAVHPGYGLLSERADFARASAEAGLTFVGPDPETLEEMGDKLRARAVAQSLDVPVPLGDGPFATVEEARAFLDKVGDPIMLKAVQGGGGRGMRRVETSDELASVFEQARAEAASGSGMADIYAEEYLADQRHIEVQVLGDGKAVTHLWDRDCTLQRRNQKVVELAPAVGLTDDLRGQMIQASLTLARASKLRGVATVEFLVDMQAGAFRFIETNPRIQVEHTVTEEVTGYDLVELQLRLAAGEVLADIDQHLLTPAAPMGTAIEVRVNTQTLQPDGTVLPVSGTLERFHMPGGQGVRVETHGYANYATNPGFDPMLVKIIVHHRRDDLPGLLQRADRALSETEISGVDTNLGQLRSILAAPEVQKWDVTTRFLDGFSGAAAQPGRVFDARQDSPKETVSPIDVPEGCVSVAAPIQALVSDVLVTPGDKVQAGQELMIIEAMKMQHPIVAPQSGRIEELPATKGDTVPVGATLCILRPDGDTHEAQEHETAIDPDSPRGDLTKLSERVALTLDRARPKAVERRRTRGQATTRENVERLCAGGEFHEYGQLVIAAQRKKLGVEALIKSSPADGIVTGLGTVNAGQFEDAAGQVAILAYDSTVMAGTQGVFGHRKTDRLLEKAAELGLASIFLTEGGGGRPNDDDFAGTMHCALDVKTFTAYAGLRGWGPKIAVNSGFCFAGNAALFGAGDIRIAARNSWIGLGGPAMIEAGGLGRFDPREVGPAPMQAEIGLVDILTEDDTQAVDAARQVLSYFQGATDDWTVADERMLRHLVPEDRKRIYDPRKVVQALADAGSFLELGAQFGVGLITGFLRIEGRPMGVMLNNPHHLGGALDAQASTKGARFMRLCNRFGLPLLSLCDTPGFMVGPDSEREGGVAAACDFIGAGADLSVPLFFVALRKGYGIGAQAMAGGSFANPVFTISWPTGEFGAMGLEGGVRLGYRKELEALTDPEAREALFGKLVARAYAEGGAINVASYNEIDAVIDPADTRSWIMRGLNAHQAADV
ncbi:acetyl-CoA carboxylase family protein [Falsiruegeria mediterranea]|uniref:2-oxoglutarate carboxylase small subunit n=1 Tax=Falsiruegeria mediterranea M17 TaxID=1200281 RepID=A0A2R8C6R4_9RHOB|nr:carboxyl transferase domain-containing protein [Falsiruegeria mediterranea]SPJ28127.1 2-oxoglutarate carboxylase small subunit [Falsiruegeria mediterranea M17]